MNLFLNEESLHGQYADMDAFSISVKVVNSILTRFLEIDIAKTSYREPSLFTKPAIGAQLFTAALSSIRDKSLRTQFSTLLDQLSMRSWSASRVHNEGPYYYLDSDITNTSVAESAERQRQNRISVLISFTDSNYSLESILVRDSNSEMICVSSIKDVDTFNTFFQKHKDFGIAFYSKNDTAHPRDSQTVLTRRSRFTATSMRNHGQTIYIETSTGRYWCVDAKHYGQSAHLEVFNGARKHISKANLDGTLIPDSGKGWSF